ncbi:MAG: hypothetical protein AMXMBFR84_36820 [Candidatus Hydrogenedentota bacterium]
MRRLMVICSCGERIQVPQSALGKMGLCPGCGQTIAITKESAVPVKTPVAPGRPLGRAVSCPSCGHAFTVGGEAASPQATRQESISHNGHRPTDDAKRRFAEAVDLYFNKRYAEALVLFNDLSVQYPGNSDIDAARQQCVISMNIARGLVLEHKPAVPDPPPTVVRVQRPAQYSAGDAAAPASGLTQETLKQVLLQKMMHGSSEEIQMRATELAFKLIEREAQPKPNGEDLDSLVHILEERPSKEPSPADPAYARRDQRATPI